MDNWVILSLIAMLATSIHVIMNKYINLYTKNCNHLVIYIVCNNKEYKEFVFDKNIKKLLLLSFAISITILFYNISLNFAVKTVKNISYCQLIINFSIILTIMLASILFKQYIDNFSLFGMLLCFIGFSIVIYNNKN